MKPRILYIILFAAVMLFGTYMVCAAQLTAQVLVNGTVWNCDSYINTCTDSGRVDFMEKLGEICTVENYNHCLSQSCDAVGAHPTQCNHYMTGDEIRDKLADFGKKPNPKKPSYPNEIQIPAFTNLGSGPFKIDDELVSFYTYWSNGCGGMSGPGMMCTQAIEHIWHYFTTNPDKYKLVQPPQYIMIDGVKWYLVSNDIDICKINSAACDRISMEPPIFPERPDANPIGSAILQPLTMCATVMGARCYQAPGKRVDLAEISGIEYPVLTYPVDNMFDAKLFMTTDKSKAFSNGTGDSSYYPSVVINGETYYFLDRTKVNSEFSLDNPTTQLAFNTVDPSVIFGRTDILDLYAMNHSITIPNDAAISFDEHMSPMERVSYSVIQAINGNEDLVILGKGNESGKSYIYAENPVSEITGLGEMGFITKPDGQMVYISNEGNGWVTEYSITPVKDNPNMFEVTGSESRCDYCEHKAFPEQNDLVKTIENGVPLPIVD